MEAGKVIVAEPDDPGNVKREHELPFKYSMMLPDFHGGGGDWFKKGK